MSCDCGSAALDKRLKIFRTLDDALWLFYADKVKATSSQNSTSNIRISSIAEFAKDKDSIGTSYVIDDLVEEDNTLFFTKTNRESFTLPVDIDGTLNANVFWAGYFDSDNKYKAIRGVKYFDFHYSVNNPSIDLVFWANVLSTDIPQTADTVGDVTQFGQQISVETSTVSTTTANQPSDLYPDSLVLDEDANNGSTQRVVFYTKGYYKNVALTLTTGKQIVTSMFIFSKPLFLFCPGTEEGGTPIPVIDSGPTNKFIELI